MTESTKLEILKEMLTDSRKELIGMEISKTIKQRMILRLITPTTEKLRTGMEQQVAIDEVNIESQEKVLEVIRELIAEEEKKGLAK